MSKLLKDLNKRDLISPPGFVLDNTHYITLMGSQAYGVSGDASDSDIYGFCIPNKHTIFPHLAGEIFGFGTPRARFDQWQKHHILDQPAEKIYDISIYSIVKYFQLCMQCNPNMIDSLFTPLNCVLHSTSVGNLVRENRKLFLHKGAYYKFKGYAISQMHKIKTKNPVGLAELKIFEKTHNIEKSTKFIDVENELKRRELNISFA